MARKQIEKMSDDEMKALMVDTIANDINDLVQRVIRHRVKLFVDELYTGIKKNVAKT